MSIGISFGGPDTRALRMLDSFRNGYWLCDQVGIGSRTLQMFFRREYIEKGAALFGRGTSASWADFRAAAGGRLDDLDDQEIEAIITFAVQRIRNYGHLSQLPLGLYEYARVVAIDDDGQTCKFCLDANGTAFLVLPAAAVVEAYTRMMPGRYAEALHSEKRLFPPFHRTCRCRIEGIGVLDDPPTRLL